MRALPIVALIPSIAMAAGGYRYEAFTNIEIEEIQSAVSELYPGAITTISGASSGCSCEEGASCTSQSWVNVNNSGKNFGLSLSRIAGHWQIGRLQKWQLRLEAAQANMRKAPTEGISFGQWARSIQNEINAIMAEKPVCTAPRSQ